MNRKSFKYVESQKDTIQRVILDNLEMNLNYCEIIGERIYINNGDFEYFIKCVGEMILQLKDNDIIDFDNINNRYGDLLDYSNTCKKECFKLKTIYEIIKYFRYMDY